MGFEGSKILEGNQKDWGYGSEPNNVLVVRYLSVEWFFQQDKKIFWFCESII